jgi:hypothetical protein
MTKCPFFNFLSTLFSFIVVTSPLWYGFRNRLLSIFKTHGNSSDSDTEEEEEGDDTGDYSMHYMTEYELLEDRELTESDIAQLQDKTVTETTDFGDIVMMYNQNTESFWYYTDHLKEVSYSLLEAVARKYVVEYKCKRLYKCSASTNKPSTDTDISETQQEESAAPSPFAKFKKYNTGKAATLNFTTGVDVVEQTNHFRYKGKLYELKTNVTQDDSTSSVPSMTYAKFKELLEESKKEK